MDISFKAFIFMFFYDLLQDFWIASHFKNFSLCILTFGDGKKSVQEKNV